MEHYGYYIRKLLKLYHHFLMAEQMVNLCLNITALQCGLNERESLFPGYQAILFLETFGNLLSSMATSFSGISQIAHIFLPTGHRALNERITNIRCLSMFMMCI